MAVTIEPDDGAFAEEPPTSLGGDAGQEKPKRRGRPPGSKNAGASGSAKPRLTAADRKNIDAAMSSMDTLYGLAMMGMTALQRPRTAMLITERQEQWQAGNRSAFEASPALAARIAATGQVSGTMIFALTNLMAAGTVMLALREETALVRAQRDAQAQQERNENPGY